MTTVKLRYENNLGFLDLACPNVNVLGEALIDDLSKALDELESAPPQTLVMRSIHKDFVLGADIKSFQTWFSDPAEVVTARIAATQRLFDRFAELPSVVIAVIDGFALGGGFELALAADYRVVTPSARVGLPEVTLGLCPGWGGSVRSARLMGGQAASEFVLSGRPIGAKTALDTGLADALVSDEAELTAFLEQSLDPQRMSRLAPSVRPAPVRTVDPVGGHQAQAAISRLMAKVQSLSLREAQDLEVATFVALAQSDEAAALVQRYLNDQAVKKASKQIAKDGRVPETLQVIGAGIMGGGIAWQAAASGLQVTVVDLSDSSLAHAQQETQRLADAAVAKQKVSQAQADEVLARLSYCAPSAVQKPSDLIIEAVTENRGVKEKVLSNAAEHGDDHTILASNTSTLSITALAESLANPDRFAGLHFFNPVPVMPLVEVIKGEQTSDQTVADLVATSLALGKRPVVVNDCPGFLVNRVLFPYLNAFDSLMSQGHSAQQIDQVMTEFGWPMGPGLLCDVIGIDTCVHASDVMADGIPERMTPPQGSVLRQLLAKGHLGQKSGAGFYRHESDDKGRLQPVAANVENAAMAPPLNAADLVGLLMAPMVEELARCVSEGIVDSAQIADHACLMGLGFPGWRCGPLFWAAQNGFWDNRTDDLAVAARGFYLTPGG